ncbi:MAG: 6-phosphofructokinase [Christensenellales bacterium]|jgi:6-phosphofructokinase
MKRKVKVGLITSGGDCQGLNAALRGVSKSLYQSIENMEIYGMYDGYRGLIENDYRFMNFQAFSGILTQGGTILGTSRQPYVDGKAIVDESGQDVMPKMLDTYTKLNLDCIVILGGNGTQKSANLLSKAGMNVVTLPKTIDNDIYGTDITFGFQSAVDIATNVMDYIHTTASSHSRIFIIELMGRDAGWLTLHAGIASGADIILIPEIPYDINSVIRTIEWRKKQGRTFSIIAVAEGAVEKSDMGVSKDDLDKKYRDAGYPSVSYKLARELEELTGQEVRVTVPGHYQRGGPPCAYDRVLATEFGVTAAELIKNKQYGRMVSVQDGAMTSVPLDEPASQTKFLPVDHPRIFAARRIGTGFGD